MSPVALDPGKPFSYTLEEEQNFEGATVFKLRPLTNRERSEAIEMVTEGSPGTRASYHVARTGLVGWENFRDPEGNPVKFDKKRLDRNLDRLDITHVIELARVILERSELSETDTKNCE